MIPIIWSRSRSIQILILKEHLLSFGNLFGVRWSRFQSARIPDPKSIFFYLCHKDPNPNECWFLSPKGQYSILDIINIIRSLTWLNNLVTSLVFPNPTPQIPSPILLLRPCNLLEDILSWTFVLGAIVEYQSLTQFQLNATIELKDISK